MFDQLLDLNELEIVYWHLINKITNVFYVEIDSLYVI